jgi:UDP-glucose:(heptosyl)LPS alpha-1,3-glucosyltransferase
MLIGLITSGDFKKRGVSLFLEALARLDAAVKEGLHVLVLGQETRLGPYRRLAEETSLGPRIRFLPPTQKVERFYHALDAYCHPALYEEFGQSVQEALACGVPVLTSRRTGAAELLAGTAYEGFLPDAPEAGRLSADIARLTGDAGLRRKLSEEGPRAVGSNTWDANFEKTRALYESLR